jgi:hypothetical protein
LFRAFVGDNKGGFVVRFPLNEKGVCPSRIPLQPHHRRAPSQEIAVTDPTTIYGAGLYIPDTILSVADTIFWGGFCCTFVPSILK